ncbi:hypothetical protein SESBI_00806 [Sesbania bispinosa]|nr:hypothetical protein SESBI_00806 [Sesbania bispinosa]
MSSRFSQWVEEECIDRASCMEDLEGFKVENTQLKKKVAKLQKTMANLRSIRRWLIVSLVFS